MSEETKNQKTEAFIKCPCCGEMTLKRPLEIKSIILDEYMAAIITGVPFAHTYTVHDSIDITVEVPPKKDAQLMFTASQILHKLAVEPHDVQDPEANEISEKLRSAVGMIQTYGSIMSIVTRKDKQVVKTYAPAEVIRNFCKSVKELGKDKKLMVESYDECDSMENLSSVPDMMLRSIVKTHNDIYAILLETGFTETFWKGIELA